jgi:pilus assembly protein Flp/PilA
MCRFNAIAQVHRFLRAREGATAVEYALIAAGIASVLIATVMSLGGSVKAMWLSVAGIFT